MTNIVGGEDRGKGGIEGMGSKGVFRYVVLRNNEYYLLYLNRT